MSAPEIPHWPTEDPRRLLKQRLDLLMNQSSGRIAPFSELDINLTGLRNKAKQFHEGSGIVDVRMICRSAMVAYWAQNYSGSTALPPEARHNLATLGHDVGGAAEMDFEDLEAIWSEAQDREKNPIHKQYLN